MLSKIAVSHVKDCPEIGEICRAHLVQDRKQSEADTLMNHIVQVRGWTNSRLIWPGIPPAILIHG